MARRAGTDFVITERQAELAPLPAGKTLQVVPESVADIVIVEPGHHNVAGKTVTPLQCRVTVFQNLKLEFELTDSDQ